MRLFSKISLAVLVLASLCFSAQEAFAQYRAGVQGTIMDPSGGAVSGAQITLTSKETGRKLTTVSDANGAYSIPGLAPGLYTLVVEQKGFKKKQVDDLSVAAEDVRGMDVTLDLGETTDSVTVNANDMPLLNTETASVSGTVTAQQFQKLPSIGRDPFQLLQLAPGAFGDGSQAAGGGTQNLPSTTIGGTGSTDGVFKIENGGQITANGARTGENNYQIDGVGTTSVTWGGTSVVTPNEDSIKEVKIITDNYDAENGRYRGAQVQIISQNGTNQYHGSLFFKIHRPGLNAYTKYNGPFNGNVRDNNRFNDWGGTAGGPVIKNRLFLFFSYETLDNNAASSTTSGWYETSQARGLAIPGTNAASFYTFSGIAPNGGSIVDQTCAQAGFVDAAHVDATHPVANCAQIAGQGLDIGSPLTGALRGGRDAAYGGCYYRDPETDACVQTDYGTGGDGLGGSNNLDGVADIALYQNLLNPNNSTHRQYNGRIDFQATKNDLIAFSMYYVPNTSTSINGNGTRLMNTFNSTYTNRAATVLWDHTFSPTLVNEVRVNAAGWINKDLSSNPNAPWGLPQISYNNIGSIGQIQGYGIGSFNGFDQWTYAAKDVLTKIKGAHTMKMGGEYTRLLSVDAPFWSDRPGYTFNNIWDFLNDAPVTENAQFDPVTGVPSALRKDVRSNLIGVFFQDNWKARSNLTLTAGLRWEYFPGISEKNGKLATVVLGQGSNAFTDLSVRTGGNLYNAPKTNFGPQLGFAWSPKKLGFMEYNNNLVIRGGFGIAFNGLVQSNTLDGRFNPPFTYNSQSLSGEDILYIDSFPANINDPNGYAPNPVGIVTFGPDNLPETGRVDLTAFPANMPTTYTYHYTLGTEYDLGHQWVASVGYQGSLTRHLTEHYNLYNANYLAAYNERVGGVTYYANDASSNFNALLLELKHDFNRSFMLDAQYRYSHTIDTGSNAYAGGNYQWDLGTGYATSDYDVRHAFKLYGVWSPTIFRGDHNWKEKIVGGWTVSGILNMHTGFPWTPFYNTTDLTDGFDPVYSFGQFAGGSSGNAGNGQILPAAYLGGFHPDYRGTGPGGTGTAYFTPPTVVAGTLFECLFVAGPTANCPDGQQGLGPLPTPPGVHRGQFTGPGYFGVDATLSKSFGLPTMKVIGENGKIELRANFYNLFNKLNLANVQGNIRDAHFGEAQNALGSRVIELQARFSF